MIGIWNYPCLCTCA